jgi:pyruvate,orthophosphate dikinase
MAVDMAGEGPDHEKTAILRVDPMALDQLLHPTLDPKAKRDVLTKGLPASRRRGIGRDRARFRYGRRTSLNAARR